MVSQLGRYSGVPVFLAFLASIASAQGVRVVTASGGLDFPEIQPAVDVAVDGDVLLVGEGSYSCFTVDGKSLSIVAVPGAEVQIGGYVCVQNLAANQAVLLSGIKVLGKLGGCIEVELLKLESNQGFVRVQDLVPKPRSSVDPIARADGIELEIALERSLFTLRSEDLRRRLEALLATHVEETGEMTFRSTREELAGWVGATREATTRMLQQMQADCIVRLSRGSVETLDLDRLMS